MPQPFDEVRDEPPCDVSVIVPTFNRASILQRTLDTLTAQRAPGIRYEILVVDNNSRDETRTVVEQVRRRDPRVRYLFDERQGVSYARNTGIAAARAPVLAFIDDDVEAGPGWVAAIKRAFDAHPEIDCLGGPIRPRWSQPPPAWLTPMFWAAVALQAAKGDPPYIDAAHATPCLMTANFACRRQALVDVGGFAVHYLRDEDRELQLRMWAAGKRGLYVDDVEVVTEVPPDRLTKAYHRQFYSRVGQSHARMRYLDRIDGNGRLLINPPRHVTLLGTPAFMYRRLFGHAAALMWMTLRRRRDDAFFHETRLRYHASYVATRRREEGHSFRELPTQLAQLAIALFRRVVRLPRNRSLDGGSSTPSGRSLRA